MNSGAISCVIVDDNEVDRLSVTVFVKKYPFLSIEGVFESATDALAAISDRKVDLMISDIDMPEISGLEFRSRTMHIPACVFITSFPDYAAESFDVEALDFLVKPIQPTRFEQCVQRVRQYFELREKARLFELSLGNSNTIYIKDGHDQVKINLHEIRYLEALKDYTRIITANRKYAVLGTLGKLLDEVSFQSFVRIHRSYAVQKHFIDRITANHVHIGEAVLPVGRSFKSGLSNLT